MSELSAADEFLLEGIRQGQSDAWEQLVKRYQGRLLAFARSRIRGEGDAEDLVQEAFLAFLRGAASFRCEASLETYLFTILRRKIIDSLRGRKVSVCLIQDLVRGDGDGGDSQPLGNVPSADMSASWYVRREEGRSHQHDALCDAMRRLVATLRKQQTLRDLKVVEMVFFCQLRNKDIAAVMGMTENQVALLKHRTIKAIRDDVAGRLPGGGECEASDALLTEVWEEQRLTCPKRSTIGRFVLGTLEEPWSEYVDFHVNRLGCRFCQANLDDLKDQSAGPERMVLRHRILESSVGFLRRV